MSGPFEKGANVTWDFAGHSTMNLMVHEVIENELIKFKWGDAHVVFSFSAVDANKCQVRLHATGFKPTQEGMNSAFRECNGWTEFLIQLMRFTEAA